MKHSLLILSMITVIAASVTSCGWKMKRNTHAESSNLTAMNTVNDTTRININTDPIDTINLLFADEGDETVMQESDYAYLAGYLSTAAYDTDWNDSGIMVKMVTPDYTAIISYENMTAEDNDWLMIWKDNGRASFRQKWFFISEDKREGLYNLLEKYRAQNDISMTVFPDRNGGAPQTLELTIRNNTDEVIQFGANYSIERMENGQWTEVDLGNFAVIAIMYGIQPGDSEKYTINLFTDRVKYPEGDYRVVKQINIGEKDARPYYANFKVIEPR